MISLSTKRSAKGAIILRLSPLFRISNALVALVVTGASIAYGAVSTFAVVLIAVTLLLSLYDERFAMDPGKKEFSSSVGIAFLSPIRRRPFSEIATIALAPHLRGSSQSGAELRNAIAGMDASDHMRERASLRRVSWRLSIEFVDGNSVVLDTNTHSRAANLTELGRELAALCEKPFIER